MGLNIYLSNKVFYTLIAIVAIAVMGVGVSAVWNSPSVYHDANNVKVTIGGNDYSLQEAINDNRLGGSSTRLYDDSEGTELAFFNKHSSLTNYFIDNYYETDGGLNQDTLRFRNNGGTKSYLTFWESGQVGIGGSPTGAFGVNIKPAVRMEGGLAIKTNTLDGYTLKVGGNSKLQGYVDIDGDVISGGNLIGSNLSLRMIDNNPVKIITGADCGIGNSGKIVYYGSTNMYGKIAICICLGPASTNCQWEELLSYRPA